MGSLPGWVGQDGPQRAGTRAVAFGARGSSLLLNRSVHLRCWRMLRCSLFTLYYLGIASLCSWGSYRCRKNRCLLTFQNSGPVPPATDAVQKYTCAVHVVNPIIAQFSIHPLPAPQKTHTVEWPHWGPSAPRRGTALRAGRHGCRAPLSDALLPRLRLSTRALPTASRLRASSPCSNLCNVKVQQVHRLGALH